MATLTLPAPAPGETVFQLVSSDSSEATVPETVTIPAGSMTTMFAVDAVDDDESDGPQMVEITAASALSGEVSTMVTVTDDEPSFEGVTPGAGNRPVNIAFIDDLRAGLWAAPAGFRFGNASVVPAGLSIDPLTGVVGGTVSADPSTYPIVIERFNLLGEVVSQSFMLEIIDGGFSEWIAGFPGIDPDPTADPDGDGLKNLIEFYLGTDPGAISEGPSLSADRLLALEFWRRKASTGVTAVVEWSDDLVLWSEQDITTEVLEDEGDRERVRAGISPGGSGHRFLRLRVE